MTDPQARFVFVLEDQFAMLAFTSAVEVLRLANKLSPTRLLPYRFLTLDGEDARASNGAVLRPDMQTHDLRGSETLLAVSGNAVSAERNRPMEAFLRRSARHGHPVWGISSGVVRLAQAGLLAEQEVSAHWEDIPYLEENFPDISVTSSLFTFGPRVATCAGGSAAADLMLAHVGRMGPDGLVEDISARMVMDRIREGRVNQKLPSRLRYQSSDPKVQLALSLMGAFLSEPLPISEIARKVGVSQRQLERLFMAQFNQSPAKLYYRLRLERARYDLLVTKRPITEIALDYGFSPGNFTRIYRSVFGCAPRQERSS